MHPSRLKYGWLFIVVIALTACTGNDDSPNTNCDVSCGERQCGPDPVCGESCGTCDTGVCNIDGQCVSAEPGCGNGIREDGEVCDGNDVGAQTCESMGFASGTLTCLDDCSAYDTSSCSSTCQPDCSGLECGPDPVCGISCGTCEPGTCEDGICVEPAIGAPVIVSFTSNVQIMEPNDTLIFSAIVTDPQGVDDVIGGTLQAPAGGTYGTFATSASEGAYTLSLTWNDLDTVSAIATPPGGTTRTFVAEFFDQSANATTATLSIALQCEDTALAACGNSCVNISEDVDHCGLCDNACGDDGICVEGVCGCTQDSSCILGEICENNFCVPGCRDSDGCPSGEFCDDGVCSAGCATDTDCNANEICDQNTHACRAGCSFETTALTDNFWAGSLSPYMADFYYLEDMASDGHHLFLTDGYSDVAIIDVSNPDDAQFVELLSTSSWIVDLKATDDTLWIRSGGNVARYDISAVATPNLTGRVLSTHWSEERIPVDFVVAGSQVYTLVYEPSGDNKAWSLLTHSIDALGNLSEENSLGLGTTDDSDGGSLALSANRMVAALPSSSQGLKVISIASPGNPEELYSIDSDAPQTAVLLNDNQLYGVSENNGTVWTLNPSSATAQQTFASSTVEAMQIHGDYLIQAARSQGIRIFNLEDAGAPFLQSQIDVNDRAYDFTVIDDSIWVADYVENISRIQLPDCAID